MKKHIPWLASAANRRMVALVAVTVGSAIVFLDGIIVTLALPTISTSLGTSFSGQQWMTDAYLLSLSSLMLLGGSLGDIFGRKRIYLIGVAGFGISSVLCGIAPSSELLIAARIVQGAFGALLVPGALAIINTTFPLKERGKAIGQWTAWSGIATVAAPFVAGGILSVASWQWIFYVNVPLAAICFYLAYVGVAETRDTRVRRLDSIGALLVTLALGGMAYGLIEGPAQQWNTVTLTLLAFGVVFLALFIRRERRIHDPMVNLGLFLSRNFTTANIMTFLMYGALGGMTFIVSIYLQTTLGYTPLQAGLSLMPVSIVLILLSGRMGALAEKHGPRMFLTFGPILAGVGMALLYPLQAGDSYVGSVFPGILLFALGIAIMVAPLVMTVMVSVDESHSGIASAVNNAVSRVAGLVVVALLGLLGAASAYRFGMALCAGLALLAGIVSYVGIVPLRRR